MRTIISIALIAMMGSVKAAPVFISRPIFIPRPVYVPRVSPRAASTIRSQPAYSSVLPMLIFMNMNNTVRTQEVEVLEKIKPINSNTYFTKK